MYEMSRIGLFLLYGSLLLKNSSALTCFNCQGIRHPRFCEYVKDCIDGQVCGLERQVESNGAVIFSLGCFSQNTCSTNPSTVDGRQKCYQCCSSELCNIHGCAEPDLGITNDMVCYNCLGLLDPDACRSVSFCEKSELCYLEEKTHFGESFYHSGCREKHICDAQTLSFPIIGRRDIVHKRSTTHLTCCDFSLCNDKGYGMRTTTTLLSKLTSNSKTTAVSITNLPDICSINRLCYNGATCQSFNGTYTCICAVGYLGEQCQYSDGKGYSFMIIFHEGFRRSSSEIPKILIASEFTTNISVFTFNNTEIKSVTIDKNNVEYKLSRSVLPFDGISLAGVVLHSDIRINVYGFVYDHQLSDGFLSMPLRFASTKYVIPTLTAYSYHLYTYKNLMALTPVYQNTVVNIHLKLKSGSIMYNGKLYDNNDTMRLVINKYNTFQLSHSSDLSGTLVTASKPVVVVSGNQCNYAVAPNLGSCQSFAELVLPTDQLDNLYITPYISTRLNSTVRIQAINNTFLTTKTGNKTISKTLNARDFLDFYYSTISYIVASDDILVMSYPHGLSGSKGDAFMMTIPGVNQYLYEYDFVVQTGFDSFMSITVPSDAIDGFLLDGNSSNIRRSIFSISEGLNHFSTFSMSISTGFHHIEHRTKQRFGLWVYGNGEFDGYGYPAGMAYKTFN